MRVVDAVTVLKSAFLGTYSQTEAMILSEL